MFASIDRERVRSLVDDGAQVVERSPSTWRPPSVRPRSRLAEAYADGANVTFGQNLAVGEVDRDLLRSAAADVPLLDVMGPVPSTVRPSVTVPSRALGGGGRSVHGRARQTE